MPTPNTNVELLNQLSTCRSRAATLLTYIDALNNNKDKLPTIIQLDRIKDLAVSISIIDDYNLREDIPTAPAPVEETKPKIEVPVATPSTIETQSISDLSPL